MKRELGFYWVLFYSGKWCVAEWAIDVLRPHEGFWLVPGCREGFSDDKIFFRIVEKNIINPRQ